MEQKFKYCLIIFGLFVSQFLAGQEKSITYHANKQPLPIVLNEISKSCGIKFAYDPDVFQKIDVSFILENGTATDFLKLLDTNYHVKSKLVDNTWILIYRKPQSLLVEEGNLQPKNKSTFSGYIKDAVSGENLLYCGVQYDGNKGVMTNNLGYFSIEIPDQKTDSIRIFISHLGYQRLDTTININSLVIILLRPAEILMNDIEVIEVEKNVLEAAPQADKIGFNPSKSSNIPRVANDDLANALLLIPGISFLQGSYSGLSIRGSSPTDNLILFDGIPVLETSHLLGNISVLNSKYVHQAFVSRGGFDAEFGGRVSGLIELSGQTGKNNGTFVELSANLLNTNLLANVPLTEKISVTAAWRRSFIDSWQNYLYTRLTENVENTVIENTESSFPNLKYQDVNANINFHPSEKLEFSLNMLYGDDNQSRYYQLQSASNLFRSETAKSNNSGFSFNWNWQITRKWNHAFTAGYSKLNKNILDESGATDENGLKSNNGKTLNQIQSINQGENHIEEYRLQWKNELKTGIFRNQFGLEWISDDYTYNFYADRNSEILKVDSITGAAKQYLLNAFVQQHIQVLQPLKIRWGIRASYDLYQSKTFWQPRACVEYQPTSGLNLHYSTGIYYQFLSSARRIDSEGHFSPLWYLPENEGIGVVKGIHHVAGLTYEKNGWMVNAEGYLKKSDGKITLIAEAINNGNFWEVKYFPHLTYERSKGIDLFVQKKSGRFNHMLGYSLSKAEEQIEDVLNNNWFPWNNDRTHQFKLNEMYELKNWSFTGSWHVGTGLPIINLSEDMTVKSIERTDYFSQIDFAVVRKFNTRHFTADAGISLLNILNRTNIVEVDYLRFSSESASISVRSDISALGFTPLFFVNVKIR